MTLLVVVVPDSCLRVFDDSLSPSVCFKHSDRERRDATQGTVLNDSTTKNRLGRTHADTRKVERKMENRILNAIETLSR